MSRILVVEDDPAVRDVVETSRAREGLETFTAATGEAAPERLGGSEAFDLVVLDVMLPGMDGVSVCRELRSGSSRNKTTTVIMLTARDDETSVVVGLEVGADDYVTKPFRPREPVGRVRAHLRRRRIDPSSAGETRKLEFPGLEEDLLRREVTSQGRRVSLTAKEFEVLALLASPRAGPTAASRSCATSGTGTFSARRGPPTSTSSTSAKRSSQTRRIPATSAASATSSPTSGRPVKGS